METADIITPPVDDPFTFGRVAATNAISDVYAMGARPVTAMNLVFFPACSLPGEILREILAGGNSVLKEAGVCLVGGHTVEDDELKYGLSVTGLIDPGRIIRNSTVRPGDVLLLTKPLGTGIISTAIKGEMAPEGAAADASAWMTTSNRAGAELMRECNASAATDVTGFGLIGHCSEMAQGAGASIRLRLDAIPLMSGVTGLVADGMVPAGCYRNRDHYAPLVSGRNATDEDLLPLFDPQTSGGLLISLAPGDAERFLAEAPGRGIFTRQVGLVLPRQSRPIEIV
ncbi:selenide, water dikinase [Geobacter sp. AOG2]|nr:selenide, water dikinase [Geobacter sp. AOG2]